MGEYLENIQGLVQDSDANYGTQKYACAVEAVPERVAAQLLAVFPTIDRFRSLIPFILRAQIQEPMSVSDASARDRPTVSVITGGPRVGKIKAESCFAALDSFYIFWHRAKKRPPKLPTLAEVFLVEGIHLMRPSFRAKL